MPNVYLSEDVFERYVKDEGSIEDAKERVKSIVAANAPEVDDGA